ncbi:ABC transporter ATP-binding protein [Gudongella oleilytica]|uniref:ABC transporter ATP-binding protein n=1 Tax=Gudongella oleilytica TaxID=1582259 RepID=UPI002A360302|nr:ABC transporter ATP-binding protein [Gudongella oleilytica]MDY0257807.1 ABC transporter ATP-binding protein [Gudongella oleilytica]
MSEDRRERSTRQMIGRGGPPRSGMTRPPEKAKDFKGTLKRLLKYLKPYNLLMLAVAAFSILSTIFSIISPRVMGFITTHLYEGISSAAVTIDRSYISRILLILGGLYLASGVFGYAQQFIMADISQKLVYDLRREINEKLHRLPLRFFDSKTTGEILSRVSNDVDTISSTLQQSVTQAVTAVITLIGILVMMLIISPVITLATLITIPLSILLTKNIARISQKYFAAQAKSLGDINGHIEETFSGHSTVKAYGNESKAIQEFERINRELYEHGWKSQFITGIIMPLMQLVNSLGYIVVAVLGGIFVIRGTLPIGDVQAFIQYSRQFNQPIMQLAEIINTFQSTIASAERVFELLDEKEEDLDPTEPSYPQSDRSDVRFENVTFGYTKDKPLMEELSLEACCGDTVAIVGPTGAGKTTLVNLLMRFYEIDGGKITIDGVSTRDMTRHQLRERFGMVLQDTWLFNGTIWDNIAYGREGAKPEEIIEAARLAQADHFIRTLPQGYDTILNEEASNISQGQKQLLTIARAILANPSILILDEATSSVDTRTEVLIQKGMDQLMRGRTSFVIAHRLSTIKNADMILVMNEGRIIEKGTHQELLESKGFYAELYNSQFAA